MPRARDLSVRRGGIKPSGREPNLVKIRPTREIKKTYLIEVVEPPAHCGRDSSGVIVISITVIVISSTHVLGRAEPGIPQNLSTKGH